MSLLKRGRERERERMRKRENEKEREREREKECWIRVTVDCRVYLDPQSHQSTDGSADPTEKPTQHSQHSSCGSTELFRSHACHRSAPK